MDLNNWEFAHPAGKLWLEGGADAGGPEASSQCHPGRYELVDSGGSTILSGGRASRLIIPPPVIQKPHLFVHRTQDWPFLPVGRC